MSYYRNITNFESIDDWRVAYRERTNNSMPLQVCHDISKLMKHYDLSFKKLAILIEKYDGLPGTIKHLEEQDQS